MKKRKTSQQKDKIILLYQKGEKVELLSKRYNISRSIIYLWISETKKISTLKKHHSIDFKNEIIQRIQEGSKITELCELFNLSQSTVYHWVKTIDINPAKTIQTKVIEKVKYDLLLQLFKTYSITNSMNIEERISLIAHNCKTYNIKLLCELFDVNRSTYYNYINHQTTPQLERDNLLKKQISEIYYHHKKIASASKIKVLLQDQNMTVSEKKIRFLMTELGIQFAKNKFTKKYRRPRTSIRYKNILKQDFNQTIPNRVWVSDTTEIKINYKPVYLCVIIDLFSRKVISYELSKVNNTRFTLNTYKSAVTNRKTHPMIFHSDRGVQYTSKAFRTYLQNNEVLLSYSAAGYPYDNAVVESFFSHFKKEAVYPKYPFSTIQSYKSVIINYIDYYNKQRLHQGIGMITPNLKEGLYKKNNHM
ncbi:MAG: IS3 family transposase [Acholeplasmataceae bacterium]|nr:IS3 family transposase [Acholeplasmataceae bacterium]